MFVNDEVQSLSGFEKRSLEGEIFKVMASQAPERVQAATSTGQDLDSIRVTDKNVS